MPALFLPILAGAANLLRLPALAAFLASLFAQIVAFFAQFFAVKTAMQLGVVASVVALTVGFFATIKALLIGIVIVAPPDFAQAMSLIIPNNLPICMSAIVSAHVVRWVWIWQVHFIEFYAGIR
jgi:hypothetical protein